MNNKNDTERKLIFIALIIVIVSTIFDVLEDWGNGDSIIEVFIDLAISGFVVLTLLYIWVMRPSAKQQENIHLSKLMKTSNNDLLQWKSKASKLLNGLGTHIDGQLEIWSLSSAEKEVALLLIKGFSLKDIAKLRNRSEKTIRQQASNVYAKANLESRAELSAFFLEDLLLPE